MTNPTPTPLDLDASSEAIERMADQVWNTAGTITMDVGDSATLLEGRRHADQDIELARALVAEVRRLRAVIEGAPHETTCLIAISPRMGYACSCWKRDALAGVTP